MKRFRLSEYSSARGRECAHSRVGTLLRWTPPRPPAADILPEDSLFQTLLQANQQRARRTTESQSQTFSSKAPATAGKAGVSRDKTFVSRQ